MIFRTDYADRVLFECLLQKQVEFYVKGNDNKKIVVRRGKFLNFMSKLPFYFFKIENDKGKIKDYHFPIPFDILQEDDMIIFDYRLEKMVDDDKLLDKMKKLGKNCESNLFNTLLYIKPL